MRNLALTGFGCLFAVVMCSVRPADADTAPLPTPADMGEMKISYSRATGTASFVGAPRGRFIPVPLSPGRTTPCRMSWRTCKDHLQPTMLSTIPATVIEAFCVIFFCLSIKKMYRKVGTQPFRARFFMPQPLVRFPWLDGFISTYAFNGGNP